MPLASALDASGRPISGCGGSRLVSSPFLVAAMVASALAAGAARHGIAAGFDLQDLNLFLVAAIGGAGLDLWRGQRGHAVGGIDVSLFLTGLLLIAAPFQSLTWLSLLLAALICLRQGDPALRSAGVLLAAISLYLLKGPVWAGLIAPVVLEIEALALSLLVGALFGSAVPDGNMISLWDGRSLVILRDCSLVNLLAPSVLGAVGIHRLLDRTPDSIAWTALIVALCVVFLNLIRLLGMAYSAESYVLFHDGIGRDLFVGAVTVLVILVASWRRD